MYHLPRCLVSKFSTICLNRRKQRVFSFVRQQREASYTVIVRSLAVLSLASFFSMTSSAGFKESMHVALIQLIIQPIKMRRKHKSRSTSVVSGRIRVLQTRFFFLLPLCDEIKQNKNIGSSLLKQMCDK